MPPPFAIKADVHRDDDPELEGVEGAAIGYIHEALQEQHQAVRRIHDVDAGTMTAVMAAINAALLAESGMLLRAITRLLEEGTAVGVQAAINSVTSSIGFGLGVDWALADVAAADFVRGYAFDLVTGINTTTASRLRGVLVDWIEKGGDLDDLTASIRPIFANEPATARIEAIFNVDRARMIAETEATRAYAEGKVAGYSASGLADYPPERKPPDDSHVRCRCDVTLERQPNGEWHWIWLTANDELVCSICGPLHGQSVGLAKEASTAVATTT